MVKTIHYCDRCGVEISNYRKDVVFRGYRNVVDDSLEISDIVELCIDCKRKLFNWLRTPDEDTAVTEESTEEPAAKSNGILDEKIEVLALPVREYNCLRRANVDTVGMLCDLSEKNLRSIKGLGKRSIEKIKKALEEWGLSLYEEVE